MAVATSKCEQTYFDVCGPRGNVSATWKEGSWIWKACHYRDVEYGCAFVALDRKTWNACQILFKAEL